MKPPLRLLELPASWPGGWCLLSIPAGSAKPGWPLLPARQRRKAAGGRRAMPSAFTLPAGTISPSGTCSTRQSAAKLSLHAQPFWQLRTGLPKRPCQPSTEPGRGANGSAQCCSGSIPYKAQSALLCGFNRPTRCTRRFFQSPKAERESLGFPPAAEGCLLPFCSCSFPLETNYTAGHRLHPTVGHPIP